MGSSLESWSGFGLHQWHGPSVGQNYWSGLSLPKGKKPLLDSLFRIYQLLNGEIQTFVSQQPEAKETD